MPRYIFTLQKLCVHPLFSYELKVAENCAMHILTFFIAPEKRREKKKRENSGLMCVFYLISTFLYAALDTFLQTAVDNEKINISNDIGVLNVN